MSEGASMRIAFFAHLSSMGGASRSLADLVDALRPHGVVPFVITPEEGYLTQVLAALEIGYAVVPMRSFIHEDDRMIARCRRLVRNLLAFPEILRILRAFQPDLVVTNELVIPSGVLAARVLRIPHAWYIRSFLDLDYGLKPDLGSTATRWLMSKSEMLICNSKAVKDHVLGPHPETPIRIVYNGVVKEADLGRLPDKRTRVDGAPFIFLHLGHVRPSKGQGTSIRAMARIAAVEPDARLWIVGDGDTTGVERLATELGVSDRIEFKGPFKDPYFYYAQADVALMASTSEAFGRTTAEALVMGCPVLFTLSGGSTEVVQHEETGLGFEPGDDETLAAHMIRLVRNPELTRRMGRQARKDARARFTNERYARDFLLAVESLLRRE